MAWLKIYGWEHEKFPWSRELSIVPNARVRLAELIGKAYGVRVHASLTTRGGGTARGYYVDLPRPSYDCPVGLIIHEVAHVVSNDQCYYPHKPGHGPKFKKNLIKMMVEVRYALPKMLKQIGEENQAQHQKWIREAEKIVAKTSRRLEQKDYRKTRAYRIELAVKKVARYEKKIKSYAKRLQKAKRSLSALRRAEIKAGLPDTVKQAIKESQL